MSARNAHSKQRGMALIAALFLIVVLAGVGMFAVRIGNGQQQSVNLTLLSSRALTAANSGIEFGANRALKAATPNNCLAAVTLNLAGALNGFSVRLICASSSHTVNGVPINVYQLDAFAQRGNYGSPGYVSRHVTRTVGAP